MRTLDHTVPCTPLPKRIKPRLATPSGKPPGIDSWVREIKWEDSCFSADVVYCIVTIRIRSGHDAASRLVDSFEHRRARITLSLI
ncbi:hypothetical protein [Beijerinckia sp. L45]|uniref:hypothetical protein n=1 Tax=Beijerinckia sp. L45 TaxID=1641855 RepID=UPI00131B36E7|nr:hypothetical protein [Beijerinckia sp. L45]